MQNLKLADSEQAMNLETKAASTKATSNARSSRL